MYWTLVFSLLLVGVVGIFSIGLPLLLLGLTLIAVAPYRRRPTVFWPPILGVVGFIVSFVLVAPLGCTTTMTAASSGVQEGMTRCTNLLGLNYSGRGVYNPSLRPAFAAALGSAAGAALIGRWALRRLCPGGRI